VPIERIRVSDTSYSDLVVVKGVGHWVYVAGQLAFDDDRRVIGDDVVSQAHTCFDRIDNLLHRAGGDLSNVVSITVYLSDLDQYPDFDRVRAERFREHRPASAAFQVAGLLFGGLIEIAAVAFVPVGRRAAPRVPDHPATALA
jgi:2-iminobutanoate/2-iminopropanoate deaminase